MGATITDGILQSGQRYETVVFPRVKQVLKRYPKAKTTQAFLEVLEHEGPKSVLNWRDDEKPRRVMAVLRLFAKEGISREKDLREWLDDQDNVKKLSNYSA